MDMRFHWLRCRANQRQFRTYWCAGPTNEGDYVTKHHAVLHNKKVRADYLTLTSRLEQLRHHIQAKITGLASRVTKVAHASFTKSTARVCQVRESGPPNYLDTAGVANHGRRTDESPVGGTPPSGGNGTPRVLGYSKRSEPRMKDRRAADEVQTHPHRWKMTVRHKK